MNNSLKNQFLNDYKQVLEEQGKVSFLVIGVTLPTGEVEVITNAHNIESKVEFYKRAYTDDLVHAMNDKVRIVNWMFV
jgi:hypothetical protein